MPASTPDARDEDDIDALLRLVLAGGRSRVRRELLDTHGSATAVLAAGPDAWREAGLDEKQVAALLRPDAEALECAHAWLHAPGHQLLGWRHPDYPPLLREITSPPLALFVAGDAALLWRPALAVVGSRGATAAGRAHATAFARAFSAAGLPVASGLAAGIDAAAHRAALTSGDGGTIAVLGSGPDVAYPVHHRGLLDEVAAGGAVVSEHSPGTQPRREFFPSRNRILAGLTLGTLVVEAGARSGALITARQAAEAGREVFAIPGSIRNPLSRGCHRLIRDGASLVEEPRDVLEALAPTVSRRAGDLRRQLPAPIQDNADKASETDRLQDPEYNRLWQALGFDPSPMDELVFRSGLTAAELSSMLLVMELEGCVVVEHGRYSRK